MYKYQYSRNRGKRDRSPDEKSKRKNIFSETGKSIFHSNRSNSLYKKEKTKLTLEINNDNDNDNDNSIKSSNHDSYLCYINEYEAHNDKEEDKDDYKDGNSNYDNKDNNSKDDDKKYNRKNDEDDSEHQVKNKENYINKNYSLCLGDKNENNNNK